MENHLQRSLGITFRKSLRQPNPGYGFQLSASDMLIVRFDVVMENCSMGQDLLIPADPDPCCCSIDVLKS